MISAPYNFVPLSDKVYFPDWAEQISHDIPFEDGEDGVITLKIVNSTPLFVRDGHTKEEKTEWSCHIIDSQGKKKFFIPGTSLKGCFRSVLEIISFSKFNHYDNASFGYRSFTTKINDAYRKNMDGVKCCGWLYKSGDKYLIDECIEGIQKIPHKILCHKFPNFNKGKEHLTAEIKQKSLSQEIYPLITVSDAQISYKENNSQKIVPTGSYRVVCTGYMDKKANEYLFSEEYNTIEVSKEVFRAFDTIHRYTPYYAGTNGNDGFLKSRFKCGHKIPIFFEKKDGKVIAMGITRMFRYPFYYSLENCVSHTSKEHFEKDRRDLSESIFGYIGNREQLKGRVQIGSAFADEYINDEDCVPVSGVLGQPRSSYYPLYLKQEGGFISNYSTNNVQLAGRKRYRITKNGEFIELSKGNGNENVETKFRPIPANRTFTCKIRVHNLKKAEIGALLSAIIFNGTPETYHNLGLAKSYGYGAFSCGISLSDEFKYSKDEYIKCFNEKISYFLQQHNSSLKNEILLNKLVEIASATHGKKDMKQMDFDECAKYKEDQNFSVLKEFHKSFFVPIDESEVIKSKRLEDFNILMKQCENLTTDESIKTLENFKFLIIGKGMDDIITTLEKEIERINQVKQKRQEKLAQEKINQEQELIAENRKRKLDAGLSFLLEQKVGNENELKIAVLSNGVDRIAKFLKKHSEYKISEGDKETIKEWLHSLHRPSKKNDLKDFTSFESHSWRKISEWIGQELAEQWFREL